VASSGSNFILFHQIVHRCFQNLHAFCIGRDIEISAENFCAIEIIQKLFDIL